MILILGTLFSYNEKLNFCLFGGLTVSKQVEKSPMSDKDVGHTTSIVSRPFISRTMISKPEQGFQKKIIFSENSEGKVTLSEDDTLNYFENETSRDAHTSKRERKSKEEISFENLREHFGRPLDNAATSFGGMFY